MGVTAGEVLGVKAPGAGEEVRLPVMLLDSDGAVVTGEAWDAGGMTVAYAKEGASSFTAFPSFATTNWDEIGYGCYDVILDGDEADELALLNTEGHCRLYVKTDNTRGDIFLYKVNPADVARDDQWTDARAGKIDTIETAIGTVTGLWSITLTVEDDGGNPLQGQLVQLKDAAGNPESPPKTTDASGQVTWSKANGTYKVHIDDTPNYAWDNSVVTVTIADGNETATITGTAFTPPSPSAAELCVLYGYLEDGGGNALDSQSRAVVAELEGDYRHGNTAWTKDQLTADTNASGYFTLEVPRQKHLCSGSEADGSGTGTVKLSVQSKGLVVTGMEIPDAANKNFWDLVRGV